MTFRTYSLIVIALVIFFFPNPIHSMENKAEVKLMKDFDGGKKKSKKKRYKSSRARGRYHTIASKTSKSYISKLIVVDSLITYAENNSLNYFEYINLLYSAHNCKAIHYWNRFFHDTQYDFVSKYYNTKCAIVGRIVETRYDKITFIDSVFTQYHIPIELKYLAVIESYLNDRAFSRVGAAGAWQFMKPTGRLMGLKIVGSVDERRDLDKSTVAAAKYLNHLYDQFHDWLLVVAAYNCGPGKVARTIAKYGTTDFWTIESSLPLETRRHVKKFIATYILMELMLKNGDSHTLQTPFMASISKVGNVLEDCLQETEPTLSTPVILNPQNSPSFTSSPQESLEVFNSHVILKELTTSIH